MANTPTQDEPKPQPPRPQRYCLECGKTLNHKGDYCNNACKQRAYRKRHKETEKQK